MSHDEVYKAINYVRVGKRLDDVADEYRLLLRKCVTQAELGGKYGFRRAEQDSIIAPRFECAHGEIRVMYDQVVRDGFLRGRLTFHLVKKTALDELEAREIHAFLFNEEGIATWNVEGPFVWTYYGVQVGDETAHNLMSVLLLAVTKCIPVLPS